MTRIKTLAATLMALIVVFFGVISPAQAASPNAADVITVPLEGTLLNIYSPGGEFEGSLSFVSGNLLVVVQQIPKPFEEDPAFDTVIIKTTLQNAVAANGTGSIVCRLTGADQKDDFPHRAIRTDLTFNPLTAAGSCPLNGVVTSRVAISYAPGQEHASIARILEFRVTRTA